MEESILDRAALQIMKAFHRATAYSKKRHQSLINQQRKREVFFGTKLALITKKEKSR